MTVKVKKKKETLWRNFISDQWNFDDESIGRQFQYIQGL